MEVRRVTGKPIIKRGISSSSYYAISSNSRRIFA
jgi:hypothetical protein